MNPTDPRFQPGALIQCQSGRVYEVVRPEETSQQNYGRLGGTLAAGLFVAISAPSGCPECRKVSPHGNAEPGHIGWISAEQADRSVLVEVPACPAWYEDAA